jgi:hypothetical protein
MMTRAEHLAWCKERALAELDAGGPLAQANALASITSDLRKHPDTAGHAAIVLTTQFTMAGDLQGDEQIREWLDGIQ